MSNTWHRFGKDDYPTPRSSGARGSYANFLADGDDADEDFGSQHIVRPVRGAKIYENTRKKAQQQQNRKMTR